MPTFSEQSQKPIRLLFQFNPKVLRYWMVDRRKTGIPKFLIFTKPDLGSDCRGQYRSDSRILFKN